MATVKPRSIAYAAIHVWLFFLYCGLSYDYIIQLHLGLSDASRWTTSHNGYNYQDLWNFIVDFFEDPVDEDEEKRAKELLKWWNEYVFPSLSLCCTDTFSRIFTGTHSAANNRGTKMTSRKQDVKKRLRRSLSPLTPTTNESNRTEPQAVTST